MSVPDEHAGVTVDDAVATDAFADVIAATDRTQHAAARIECTLARIPLSLPSAPTVLHERSAHPPFVDRRQRTPRLTPRLRCGIGQRISTQPASPSRRRRAAVESRRYSARRRQAA